MKSPKSHAERDYQNEQVFFAIMIGAGVVGVIWFPALAFGLCLGLAGAFAVPKANREFPEERSRCRDAGLAFLFAAVIVGLVVWALAQGPTAGEARRFAQHWNPKGPSLISYHALLDYPWGWLPQALAIALGVGGIATVVRSGRR